MFCTAYHGIGVYNRKFRGAVPFMMAVKALPFVGEVCVSDHPVGSCGVVISGHVSALYDEDCHSVTCIEGERKATQAVYKVSDPCQSDFDDFDGQSSYKEGFMLPAGVRALWVKKAEVENCSFVFTVGALLRIPVYVMDESEYNGINAFLDATADLAPFTF